LLGLILFAGSAVGTNLARAQSDAATPVAAGTSTLEEMLALAPDVLSGTEAPQFQVASFGDAEAQLAAAGVSAPDEMRNDEATRDWLSAVNWVLFPDFITSRNAEWRAVFGFDLLQVDQALTLGEPPNTVAIMRGRFDEDAISSALTTARYQPVNSPDAVIYSLDPEPRVDFDSEIGQLALARMNNVAILPDGTLICAPSLALVQSVISVAAGTVPSLASRQEIQTLLRAQSEPLASALLVTGGALMGTAFDPASFVQGTPATIDAVATRMAEISEMPPILLALLGTTAGGPLVSRGDDSGDTTTASSEIPAARFDINLLMADAASADTAVEVATERLETALSVATGKPYAEYFANWTGRAVTGTSVARLQIHFADGVSQGIWLQMLFQRDLLFIAW
jgi:hypothetical protein